MRYKKYLPFIIFGLGLAVIAGVLFWVLVPKENFYSEETTAEIPFEKRPFVTLTPTADGHYLKMRVLNIIDAKTLDYELLYEVPDKPPQGVPGTVDLTDMVVERELLLGSESSGKFRYDEGVEWGTLTFRFRDDKGKLVGKLATTFHLQSGVEKLVDKDGLFSYTLDEESEDYFIVMNTLGLPKPFSGAVDRGPFAVLSSHTGKIPGEVGLSGDIYRYDTAWTRIEGNSADDIGVFITSVNSE